MSDSQFHRRAGKRQIARFSNEAWHGGLGGDDIIAWVFPQQTDAFIFVAPSSLHPTPQIFDPARNNPSGLLSLRFTWSSTDEACLCDSLQTRMLYDAHVNVCRFHEGRVITREQAASISAEHSWCIICAYFLLMGRRSLTSSPLRDTIDFCFYSGLFLCYLLLDSVVIRLISNVITTPLSMTALFFCRLALPLCSH